VMSLGEKPSNVVSAMSTPLGDAPTHCDLAESVSVVVPTKNRPEELSLVVASLLKQTSLPDQIVIVDQSQSELGQRLVGDEFNRASGGANTHVRLDYVRDPKISGAAVARNRAMEVAFGAIYLFLDDDVELESDFLERILEIYRKYPEVGGVSGTITNYPRPHWTFRLWAGMFVRGDFHDERQPIYWRSEQLRNSEPIAVTKFGGGLMSFRVKAIKGVAFDSNLTGVSLAEDIDFCARIPPVRLLINPRARLVHKRNSVGRAQDHWLRAHAQSSYYMYARNWHRGLRDHLCFAWLNIGYLVLVCGICLRKQSLNGWRAWRAGIAQANRALARSSQI
jgi:glucosyl-dolichyl phosphate glucuronosyltransferase